MKRGGTNESESNACLENKRNGIRDLSILQKPIETSITGFKEVVRAYNNGTEEIKMLLDNECDIIYECKACRNIFRSLANFISHKRTYCKTKFNSSQHFHFRQNDHEISTIIEQSDLEQPNKDSRESKEHVRDLGSIIDRLMRREQTSQVLTLSDLYDQASQNLTQDEVIEKKQVLQLDKMLNSEVAVYQTLKKDEGDSIKKEVNEIHDMMENVETILGPDGKVSTGIETGNVALKFASMRFSCKICTRKFVTEKTLKLHIKAKHIPSTNVYPCNACPRTFLLPAGLIRHLNNDHKKPMRRIRLMREAIFKRRIRKDEVQSKGPSRELARLQNSNREQPEKAWILDSTDKIKVSSICIFCAKSFDRRAALITHTKNCSLRGKRSVNVNSNDVVDSNNLDKSVESFMAMLKREKEIQANVQKCIDEEEVQIMGSEENSLLGNDELTKNDSEMVVVKNKRKRNFVQKIDQPAIGDHHIGDISWNMNDDENSRFIKADDVKNGDLVISATTNSDIVQMKSSTEKRKKKKLILEKTTDCTMCPKKFTNISNLRRHVAMLHYRQKTFGCKLCDYKAFRKIDIINHLGVCHNIGGEPEVCSELVVNIQIDSNKFNDEKIKAVAPALNNIEKKLLSQSLDTEKGEEYEEVTVEMKSISVNIELPAVTILPISSNDITERAKEKDTTMAYNGDTSDRSNNSIEDNNSSIGSNGEKLKKRGRRFKVTNSLQSRQLSQNSSSDSLPETQPSQMNRPVRNRVKTMNKDFVYDLSNLLRKEAVVYKEQLIPMVIKNQKRKLSQASDSSYKEKEDNANESLSPKRPYADCITGSAISMAQLAIDSHRACSNKPPEVPSERPIVPAKIIQMRRSTNGIHNWRVVHNDELTNFDQPNRHSPSDKLLEALANKSRLFGVGTNNTSTEKGIDLNTFESKCFLSNILTSTDNSSCLLDTNDEINYSDELVCQQLVVTNSITNNLTEPNNAFLVSPQTEPLSNGTGKRITLLQRLMENQSKKKDNWMKMEE